MKIPSNKVAKYMLFVGIVLYMMDCCVAVLFDEIFSPDSWGMILLALPVAAVILVAGFIYTENIKKTHRRRFWTIRIISTVYIIGIIALIVGKLSNKLA